jgi:hypothetical protein
LHKLSSPSNQNASKPEIFVFVEKILFFSERFALDRDWLRESTENWSPNTICQMAEPERVRAKLSVTEICDCFNLEKTKTTHKKTPPAFMAGGVFMVWCALNC